MTALIHIKENELFMRKIQFFIALYIAKCTQLLLKILGRNATYFPGKVAVKLCKNFLARLTPPKTVVAVTGTNGKTTVSNLISSILIQSGYSVTNNSFGSNVQAGVISALIADTTLTGKPKKDIAILEVDERSSLLVYPYLKPDFLVCNNIMRDSLKRNAHTEFISYIIQSALPSSTRLILNADDLICATLGSKNQACVYFGLETEKPEVSLPQHIKDIIYCPNCGGLLRSEYIRYNHIGRLYCNDCGLKSPTPDYAVTEINRQDNTFTLRSNGNLYQYKLINDNIVNLYNFAAVIALLNQLGLTEEQIADGFQSTQIVKTRFEEITAGNLKITMLMAKGQNPIACARCYDYVANAPVSDKGMIIIVDDKDDNIGNSESTCWLYDCDYAPFCDPSITQIIFAGPRCKDHYLRAQIAGVPKEKIVITENSADAADLIDTKRCTHIFVLHELYRPEEATMIKQALIARGESEV